MRCTPAFLLLFVPGMGWAADGGTHVDATAYTDFPVSVGIRSTIETPQRLRFSASAGAFPGPYLDTIQGIATGAGWYSDALATVIDTALSRAWLMQFQAGWRPIEDRGFTVMGGYMPVFAAGGDASSTDITAAMADDQSDGEESDAHHLKSRIHLVTVQLGWEWLLAERLVLRSSVGGAFTVGSQTEATALSTTTSDRPGREALQSVGIEALEAYLDNTYQSYVHTATIGVEVGYRFR